MERRLIWSSRLLAVVLSVVAVRSFILADHYAHRLHEYDLGLVPYDADDLPGLYAFGRLALVWGVRRLLLAAVLATIASGAFAFARRGAFCAGSGLAAVSLLIFGSSHGFPPRVELDFQARVLLFALVAASAAVVLWVQPLRRAKASHDES